MKFWLRRLNSVFSTSAGSRDSVLYDFLDYFGTHIPTNVVYGATHTFESKMTASSYQKLSSESTSVDAQASFAGSFSIGGGVSFTDSQKEIVAKFQSVSVTTTKTLGSPPPKGADAGAWSESVQSSPAPIQYELAAIRDLFTYDVMHSYMSKETLTKVQVGLRDMELKYCNHVSVSIPAVRCEDTTKAELSSKVSFPHVSVSDEFYSKYGLAEYNIEATECQSKCDELESCVVAASFREVVFNREYKDTCRIAGLQETQSGEDISLKLVTDENTGWIKTSTSTSVFLIHLKQDVRLFGLQFGSTASRSARFKILDQSASYKSISETCGDFCRHTDGCSGFEASNKANYAYNCVLYNKLGSDFTSVSPFDFETTLLGLSPEIPSLKDRAVSFEIGQFEPSAIFQVQSGCVSEECCSTTCLTDPLCLVSVYNQSSIESSQCFHMPISQSNFTSYIPYSQESNLTAIATVYPERVIDNKLQVKGISFPFKGIIEVSGVFSPSYCLSKCAAYAGCLAASWGGEVSGLCVLHSEATLQSSSPVVSEKAVLSFPTVDDKMLACKTVV